MDPLALRRTIDFGDILPNAEGVGRQSALAFLTRGADCFSRPRRWQYSALLPRNAPQSIFRIKEASSVLRKFRARRGRGSCTSVMMNSPRLAVDSPSLTLHESTSSHGALGFGRDPLAESPPRMAARPPFPRMGACSTGRTETTASRHRAAYCPGHMRVAAPLTHSGT